MLDVNTCKLLQTENDKWQTPTSRHRGRPTETRQQLSENNLRTESNIWSQVPEWARYLDILTDWPSVVMWFRLRRLVLSRTSCFINLTKLFDWTVTECYVIGGLLWRNEKRKLFEGNLKWKRHSLRTVNGLSEIRKLRAQRLIPPIYQ
jgi:hypothetical protein